MSLCITINLLWSILVVHTVFGVKKYGRARLEVYFQKGSEAVVLKCYHCPWLLDNPSVTQFRFRFLSSFFSCWWYYFESRCFASCSTPPLGDRVDRISWHAATHPQMRGRCIVIYSCCRFLSFCKTMRRALNIVSFLFVSTVAYTQALQPLQDDSSLRATLWQTVFSPASSTNHGVRAGGLLLEEPVAPAKHNKKTPTRHLRAWPLDAAETKRKWGIDTEIRHGHFSPSPFPRSLRKKRSRKRLLCEKFLLRNSGKLFLKRLLVEALRGFHRWGNRWCWIFATAHALTQFSATC